MFELWAKKKVGRSSVDYHCPLPNCGAGMSELQLISGACGKDGKGNRRMKGSVKCSRCGHTHTAKLQGDKAVAVWVALQGGEKVARAMASNERRA